MATTLKDTAVKNAKPKNKVYTLSADSNLYLQVTPTGGKSWIFRYKYNGKNVKKSLGKYPDVSLLDARAKRDTARNILATSSNDPFPKKVHQQEIKVHHSFKYWSEWYIEEISKDLSDSHITRTMKSFKKDVYPIIGDMPINDIKARDIIKILHIMKERGANESARKTFSSINRVFAKAISNFPDDIDRNPTADISLGDVIGKKQTVSYPIITDDKELGRLLKTVSEYGLPTEGSQKGKERGHSSTRLALMMLSNVFTRPSNVRLAVWSEVDLKTKQWVIPASKMKTKKELIVPLSKQVIKILNEAKLENPDSEYLFPSNRSKTSPMSDNALVGALRRMGYERDEIVAHSFRGILSTIAHEKAIYSHDVIETQLAHSVGSQVSQAYNRAKHLEERTNLMQWYSDHLEYIQSDAVQKND